jgi:hypothetical protein
MTKAEVHNVSLSFNQFDWLKILKINQSDCLIRELNLNKYGTTKAGVHNRLLGKE